MVYSRGGGFFDADNNPVFSALEVSIQGQIVILLLDFQKERNFTYIFVSHDLRVVHNMADRIAVMRQGKVAEQGARDAIFTAQHPYTRMLLSAACHSGIAEPASSGCIV